MTRFPVGMDHALYAYEPLPRRTPLVWPGRKPLALTVFLYFEHWHTHPGPDWVMDPRFHDPNGRFEPDYRAFSIRLYAHRVGIFRILNALDAAGLKVTVAANAEAIGHYPYLVEAFRSRGYEFAAHGLSASRMVSSRMSEEEERSYLRDSLEAVAAVTGHTPEGWVAQDYGESERTPFLLAEMGVRYLADWANDDAPYPLLTRPRMVSIPNQAELDDVQLLWHRRVESRRYPEMIAAAAERLATEGAGSGRFLGIHIHPWLFGMPHRIRYLEAALEDLSRRTDIWPATAAEIARASEQIH